MLGEERVLRKTGRESRLGAGDDGAGFTWKKEVASKRKRKNRTSNKGKGTGKRFEIGLGKEMKIN